MLNLFRFATYRSGNGRANGSHILPGAPPTMPSRFPAEEATEQARPSPLRILVLHGLAVGSQPDRRTHLFGPVDGIDPNLSALMEFSPEAADAGLSRRAEVLADALLPFGTRGICFETASLDLAPDATVRRNVLSWLSRRGEELPRAVAAARRNLRCLGLARSWKIPAGHLSASQRLRVALARAFALPVDAVLADEVTGTLDASSADRCLRGLRKLALASRIPAVVVTRRPVPDARVARRILQLESEEVR